MRELNIEHVHFAEVAKEILSRGSSFSFKAQGISMRPFLHHGDILVIEPVEPDFVQWGDILFCLLSEKHIVVHRFVGHKNKNGKRCFIVKGDASWRAGELVKEQEIFGRVATVCRGNKTNQLDSLWYRLSAYMWVKTAPVSSLLLAFAGRIVQNYRGLNKR